MYDESSHYTKNILWFNDHGICDYKQLNLTKEKFPDYIDNLFVDGILNKNIIQPNQTILLALSGGRDSLALLYLLRRNKDRLPPFTLIGVTVADSAASKNDIVIAQEAMRSLGVDDYKILPLSYVNETMNFK